MSMSKIGTRMGSILFASAMYVYYFRLSIHRSTAIVEKLIKEENASSDEGFLIKLLIN